MVGGYGEDIGPEGQCWATVTSWNLAVPGGGQDQAERSALGAWGEQWEKELHPRPQSLHGPPTGQNDQTPARTGRWGSRKARASGSSPGVQAA